MCMTWWTSPRPCSLWVPASVHFFYQFVFPGFWHFDIGATSNIDEVLHVEDHEHVELPLVIALDMLLIPG